LADRWRKPLKVLDVEPGEEVVLAGERFVRSTRITFDRESTERIRHGYACAKCLAVFERPWPERCRDCGAPIRERQAEYFMREYGGVVHLGPRTSLADELAGLHERVAKGEDNLD
jgi:hypothetical protein